MHPKLRRFRNRIRIVVHVLRGRPVVYKLELNAPLSFRHDPYSHNVMIIECGFTDCDTAVRIGPPTQPPEPTDYDWLGAVRDGMIIPDTDHIRDARNTDSE